MNCSQPLSGDARNYLRRFYEILDVMIKGMTGAALTDSISHNFIVQMIPHHRAAIEMSENLLRYSDLAPLRRIAENIIREQTQSIADMERALPRCGMKLNLRSDLSRYEKRFGEITRVMFSEMRNACSDNNISADFMREMIPHHQGAIRMSKNALEYPICPQLDPILKAIITSQERGVREMESLLRKITCNRL